MSAKRTRSTEIFRTVAGMPHQLQLALIIPSSGAARRGFRERMHSVDRLPPLDQRMSTAEVLRVVGIHRTTLFRWTNDGRFPRKHSSGGWLRSEVESWLAEKV